MSKYFELVLQKIRNKIKKKPQVISAPQVVLVEQTVVGNTTDFPNEIWFLIFDFILDKTTRDACRCTCKFLRQISSQTWKRVAIQKPIAIKKKKNVWIFDPLGFSLAYNFTNESNEYGTPRELPNPYFNKPISLRRNKQNTTS